MPKLNFTDQDKTDIVRLIEQTELTQQQVAIMYATSRKTIYRVLQERNVLPEAIRLTDQEKRMIQYLRSAQATIPQLSRAFVLLRAENRHKAATQSNASKVDHA